MENNMDILFEDDHVCVISKSPGVSVHQDGRQKEETVADWFVSYVPSAREVGEPLVLTDGTTIGRPGIVHRLDKETSGVMVLAKTQESFLFLKKQFQNRTVEKKYRTFVWGALKDSEGSITRSIGRSRSDFRKRSAEYGAKPPLREARTDYTTLLKGTEFSYLEAHPFTGRTHQIRVHFKSRGAPIVCDRLYAEKKPCTLGFSRLALHAYSLSFTLPTGEKKTISAPLPEDFEQAEKLLKAEIA